MKKTISSFLILCYLFSCNSDNQSENLPNLDHQVEKRQADHTTDFKITLLNGYSLKNNITFLDEINPIVFNSQEKLDSYFKKINTSKNNFSTDSINFVTERVIAIVFSPNDYLLDFNVIHSKKIGTKLQIEYNLINKGNNSYISSPSFLFKIPNNDSTQSIELIHNHNHNTIMLLPTE